MIEKDNRMEEKRRGQEIAFPLLCSALLGDTPGAAFPRLTVLVNCFQLAAARYCLETRGQERKSQSVSPFPLSHVELLGSDRLSDISKSPAGFS